MLSLCPRIAPTRRAGWDTQNNNVHEPAKRKHKSAIAFLNRVDNENSPGHFGPFDGSIPYKSPRDLADKREYRKILASHRMIVVGTEARRAPAVHSETTGRPAAHSKTTGGRAPWEHPVENSLRGGRARTPIEDDSKLCTGSTSTWKFHGRRALENIDS